MSRRAAYVARRLLLTLPVLAVMSVVVFGVMHLVPGDPAQAQLGLRSTPETLAQVRSDLNLDDPLPAQYLAWVGGVVLRGDLGSDYASGVPVTEELGVALPVTLQLAVAAILLAGTVGVGIGVIAAARGGWRRRGASGFVVFGTAIPEFWMGLILILVFSAWFAVLPPSGYVALWEDPVENVRHFALPVLCLSLFQAAYFARTARTAMEDALSAPSVAFLRAKGLPERQVVWRHGLRNAAAPIVTIVGMQFGAILGGTIIIETLFDLPGVGKLLFDAIAQRSYTVVQGCVVLIAGLFVLVNLVTDLLLGWLDPRIGDGVA